MILKPFSLTEMKLIEKCADVMIESFTRLAQKSHPLFDEFYEAFKGEPDNKLDIHFLIADKIELWESIKEYPTENLKRVDNFDMMVLRMVLMDGFTDGLNKSKKSLLERIDAILRFRPDSNNPTLLN